MISNKLIKFAGFLKFIPSCPKYSFASFPSKAQKKMLEENEQQNFVKDDLLFPYKNVQFNGGIQNVRYFPTGL